MSSDRRKFLGSIFRAGAAVAATAAAPATTKAASTALAVVSEPRVIYCLGYVDWEYNDEYYSANEGMVPQQFFLDREEAEKVCEIRNLANMAGRSIEDYYDYNYVSRLRDTAVANGEQLKARIEQILGRRLEDGEFTCDETWEDEEEFTFTIPDDCTLAQLKDFYGLFPIDDWTVYRLEEHSLRQEVQDALELQRARQQAEWEAKTKMERYQNQEGSLV